MQKTRFFVLVTAISINATTTGKTKLDRLMNADMLGSQRAYFEESSEYSCKGTGCR